MHVICNRTGWLSVWMFRTIAAILMGIASFGCDSRVSEIRA